MCILASGREMKERKRNVVVDLRCRQSQTKINKFVLVRLHRRSDTTRKTVVRVIILVDQRRSHDQEARFVKLLQ